MADEIRRDESAGQGRDGVGRDAREGIGRQDVGGQGVERGSTGREGMSGPGRDAGAGERSTKREFESLGLDERAERAAGEPATGPREPQEPQSAHTSRGTAAREPQAGLERRDRGNDRSGSAGGSRGIMDKLRNAWHRAAPGRD